MAIEPNNLRQLMVAEQQRLLQTFAVLIASALERLHLARSAGRSWTPNANSCVTPLLAALSHDLRTPLTVLFGQAEISRWTWREGSNHATQASQIASRKRAPPGW